MAYNDLPPLGQTTKSASLPVTVASDQDVLATSAKQDTIIGHVDGIETVLGTIDADTSTLAGAVSGTEMQVDVVAALPAGTNAIGGITGAGSNAQIKDDTFYGDGVTSGILATTSRVWNGTNYDRLPGSAANGLTVNLGANNDVTVTGDALTSLQLADDVVFADDAAVTLGTSKGNLMAGVAVNMDGTDPAAVSAEGDAAALRTDPNRLLLVNQTHPRFWHVSADYASAQTNVSVKAAPGASLSLYITDISISNGATAGNITLLDGSGGTVLYEIYPAINGGATLSLRNPIKLTANTALCLTSTTVTTHSVFVSGYIAA